MKSTNVKEVKTLYSEMKDPSKITNQSTLQLNKSKANKTFPDDSVDSLDTDSESDLVRCDLNSIFICYCDVLYTLYKLVLLT